MTAPIATDIFNSYKTALARALAPGFAPHVRGLSVQLDVLKRHVQVVVHGLDDSPIPTSEDLGILKESVLVVTSDVADFAAYTCDVEWAPCDAATITYRGCPVWGRKDTSWELAPDLAARLAARGQSI